MQYQLQAAAGDEQPSFTPQGIRDNSENGDRFNLIQQIKGKPREKIGSIWYAHGILIDKTSRQQDFYRGLQK